LGHGFRFGTDFAPVAGHPSLAFLREVVIAA
jgi:hypothetical protein